MGRARVPYPSYLLKKYNIIRLRGTGYYKKYYICNMQRMCLFLLIILSAVSTKAQNFALGRMSPLVREAALSVRSNTSINTRAFDRQSPAITAFIKLDNHDTRLLKDKGCEVLSSFGPLHIASIPINQLSSLSRNKHVLRIEASRPMSASMDTTQMVLGATMAYKGIGLPQAFTGKGVVLGVMDIGFDLTHPNFYSRDLENYRIKRIWDQLSPDSIGSNLYVGRDYTSEDELLKIAHTYDGLTQTHGTHTTGIAAGGGYDTDYNGIATESDICLVSNATSNNAELIDSTNMYKYTSATDALGFKYIFDYADEVGKPCVINFSEGSNQDMMGEDKLYFEFLDSLVGPGKIIVSSAGNRGHLLTYFAKPSGKSSAGCFIGSGDRSVYFSMKSKGYFDCRVVAYGAENDTITIPSKWAFEAADSQYVDTLAIKGNRYAIQLAGYPNIYNQDEQAYELLIENLSEGLKRTVDDRFPFSLEVIGREADVKAYLNHGYIYANSLNAKLNDGEKTHSINSPSSAESVICVGSTGYRTHFINYLGEDRVFDGGLNGERSIYSSVGPTVTELTKPDVMAPGINVISSYSSYYIENNPKANDLLSDVERFDFNGRTYSWNCNSGTSMSSPVVAGTIALWLEANPELSPSDIKEIFKATCKRYDASLSYPNNYYGYGEVDVYKGLLHILGIDGIEQISTHQSSASIAVKGSNIEVDLHEAQASDTRISIYNTAGVLLNSAVISKGNMLINIPVNSRGRGIYVVQINGGSKVNGSKLIRM